MLTRSVLCEPHLVWNSPAVRNRRTLMQTLRRSEIQVVFLDVGNASGALKLKQQPSLPPMDSSVPKLFARYISATFCRTLSR